MTHRIAALSCLLCLAPAAPAQDRTELDRTPIVGNRELPKVLYIVPWKRPPPAPPAGRVAQGVLDERLQPLDRDVVRRTLRYDSQIRGRQAAPEGEVR